MLINSITKDIIKIESSLNINLNIIKDEIYRYLECSVTKSDKLKTKYSFIFVANDINREINIKFIPTGNDLINYFSISIATCDRKKIINLNEFIVKNKFNINDKYFSLNSYQGDFNSRINQFISTLNKIFDDYFDPIIQGKEWNEN